MTKPKPLEERERLNWHKRASSGFFENKGIWYIDSYLKGKRIRRKIGPDKKLAEIVLKKWQVATAEDKFLDKKKKKKCIRFHDLCDRYLVTYSKIEKRSWDSDVHFLKRFKEYFGNIYLDEFSSLLVAQYKADRKDKVKDSTINRELGVLKSMFSRAVEWDMAETNPVKKVKMFKVDDQKLRFLSEEEIQRLLENCSGDLHNIVMVALHTGMRRGEILSMKWEDVSLKANTISIPASNAKNKCNRDVPITASLMGIFKAIKRHPKSPYVFCHSDGKRFLDIKKSYSHALRKAEITDATFHTLRHTFCSQLALSGVDIYTIKELAGHKRIEMTMRYSHLTSTHKQKALDKLNNKISPLNFPIDAPIDTHGSDDIVSERRVAYTSTIN